MILGFLICVVGTEFSTHRTERIKWDIVDRALSTMLGTWKVLSNRWQLSLKSSQVKTFSSIINAPWWNMLRELFLQFLFRNGCGTRCWGCNIKQHMIWLYGTHNSVGENVSRQIYNAVWLYHWHSLAKFFVITALGNIGLWAYVSSQSQ